MNTRRKSGPPPDRTAALAQYRRRARFYDLELALFEPLRRLAVARLALPRGATVIDVGCGTGLSLPLLRQAVGPRGRVVGVEQSPEMIGHARRLVARKRWDNVALICAPAEAAAIDVIADAAIFHFTHDILRRDDAVANVVRHLKTGASVVACGLKWAPRWALPINLIVWPAALHSVTSLEGLDKPWSKLEKWTGKLQVETRLAGAVYLATGGVCDRRPPG